MTRALFSCERGNSFVEMALAAPVLATLLLGMIDISRGVADKLELTQVAQRTIERVQRTGYSPSNNSTLETEAETLAGSSSEATVTAWLECGNSSTKLSFTGSCAPSEHYARYVGITVTRPFTPLFGSRFFPGANSDGTYTINGEAGIRIQ